MKEKLSTTKDRILSELPETWRLSKKYKNTEYINLSIGETNKKTPFVLKLKAIFSIIKNRNQYTEPQGLLKLREEISRELKKNSYTNNKAENVLITSASLAIQTTLLSLFDIDVEIIILEPYYPPYIKLPILNNLKVKLVETNSDFSINIENIEKNITDKTKAIIINTPNNPTGKIYSENEILSLVEIAKKHNLIVISDETYDFLSSEQKIFSPAMYYTNTVVIKSFSKMLNITGWRMGYLFTSNELIQKIMMANLYTSVCAPTPFQYALLGYSKISFKNQNKEQQNKLNLFYTKLKLYGYELNRPDGGQYIYVKYPYNPEKFIKNCIDNKLVISPGLDFSSKNTHFRITVTKKISDLEKAIKIFKKIKNLD